MNSTKPARTLCLIAALLLLVQAAQAQRRVTPRGRTAVEVGEVVHGATDFAEPTVAVIPPNTNRFCREGRLVLASGIHVIALELNALNTQPPVANLITQAKTFQDLTDPSPIYDAHLVATKTGRLYHSFEAVIWRDNISPRPSWWDETKQLPLKGRKFPGGRGAIFVFSSDNCGNSWQPSGVIDAAHLTVTSPLTNQPEKGYCGYPRPSSDGKEVSAGGWDGHYLYADPNHNHLYVTTVCATARGNWLSLVIMSRNDGVTWGTIRQFKDIGFWRTPVMALSNGQVAFAYRAGNKAVVGRFKFPDTKQDFGATEEVALATHPVDKDEAFLDKIGLYTSAAAYLSLSRAANRPKLSARLKNRFLLASYNNENNAASYTLYEYVPGQRAMPFATVEAESKGRSILHGTFVEAEGENAPSIFYWLEEVGDGRFQIRFRVYYNAKQVGHTHSVSTMFRSPKPFFTGDYMGGTSYKTGHGWEFFLAWDVCTNLRFVNVFLPVSPKPDLLFASVPARTKLDSPLKLITVADAGSEVVVKRRADATPEVVVKRPAVPVDQMRPCQ